MTVCVECGRAVAATVERRDVGGVQSADSVRLARCGGCGAVCDKYEEYDGLLVLLDAMLLRRAALRHLFCNSAAAATAPHGPPRRAAVLAALAALGWLAGLRPAGPVPRRAAVLALAAAAGALPCVALRVACGLRGAALRTAAVVALDVAFPLAALALVWGPVPHHILHTGAALLYLCVLYHAALILPQQQQQQTATTATSTTTTTAATEEKKEKKKTD